MTVSAGIDISATTFDVVTFGQERFSKAVRYRQDGEGYQGVINHLRKLKPAHIVMEATGIYYFDLAVALSEAGLAVAVINPKSFKHFAQLKLQDSKTDRIDAALLAEYGARMQPRPWSPPAPQHQTLRGLGRQINRLIGSRTQAKNRLHAMLSTRTTPQLVIEDEQEGIEMLDRRIKRLRAAAEALLEEVPELKRMRDHCCAAKSIGAATALALLAELCVLPSQLKSAQISRHAGLDVRLHQSGTSVRGKARISKGGNAYIRSALYMPSMCAVRFDPNAKAFYDALVARGKTKMQAQVAVMRKYLTGIWACIKTDTPFDSSLLFSPIHRQAG